jgi:signal transduction histidine kinase
MQLRRLHRALQFEKDRLEDVVASRTRELSEAHARLTILDRAKTDFLNLISHELRTPLNGLLGVGDLILSELDSSAPGAELRDLFEQSRRRILSVIDDALLVTQIHVEGDKFTPAPISLATTWNRAVTQVEAFAAARQVTLRTAPAELGLVFGQPDLTAKALAALLETAVKFSTAREAIEPICRTTPDALRLIIDTHGATLPPPLVERFFDLLSISESDTAGGDVGLGPAVASRILSLFGGSIEVENLERGMRLTVCFRPVRARPSLGIAPLPSIA